MLSLCLPPAVFSLSVKWSSCAHALASKVRIVLHCSHLCINLFQESINANLRRLPFAVNTILDLSNVWQFFYFCFEANMVLLATQSRPSAFIQKENEQKNPQKKKLNPMYSYFNWSKHSLNLLLVFFLWKHGCTIKRSQHDLRTQDTRFFSILLKCSRWVTMYFAEILSLGVP